MVRCVKVKICGLSTQETVDAAVTLKADYIGFVFFQKSPRCITHEKCFKLTQNIPETVTKVALVVDADNALLEDITANGCIDMLQLQGQETPKRVKEIRQKTGLRIMKAVGLSKKKDLIKIEPYLNVVDQLLIDASPPKGSVLPGGNGNTFDWSILRGKKWSVPWILAGGLHASNVKKAIDVTGAQQVDVSSGVEYSPGLKDKRKIASFIKNAKSRVS